MADPGDTDTTSTSTSSDEDGVPAASWKVLAIAGVMVVLAVGAAVVALNFIPQSYVNATSTIVILLVGGVVSVMLLLYLGAVILGSLGVGSRRQALGMPEGSIRALIAVSLILMFAIIGVTVFYSTQGGETIESKGITADQIDQLENVQIVGISAVEPAASPERFDVVARTELSASGHDFGLQLLTTVATLVVAVAGFYFGSRSAGDATKSALAIQAAANRGSGAGAATAAETEADELAEQDVIEAREEEAAEDNEMLEDAEKEAEAEAKEEAGTPQANVQPQPEPEPKAQPQPEAQPEPQAPLEGEPQAPPEGEPQAEGETPPQA